jgi:protein required for attachment to host cells
MHSTWILVSDASRARLFRMLRAGGKWELLFEREHPESRQKGSEATSDRPGHLRLDHGQGFQVQMEPPKTPREIAAEHFAHELAETLQYGLDAHAYDRLILAAPPHFLRLLRGSLSDAVAHHVTQSLDEDYTRVEAGDLRRRLRDIL